MVRRWAVAWLSWLWTDPFPRSKAWVIARVRGRK